MKRPVLAALVIAAVSSCAPEASRTSNVPASKAGLPGQLVGHSFSGEELTWIASHEPARVRTLVYLDAAYDHQEITAALKHARPGTRREPPSPSLGDVRDPVAYQAFQSRGLELALPLGEVLSRWEFASDGHLVREKTDEAALGKIMSGAIHPQYDSVKAPTLALFATVTRPGASPDLAAIFASQREAFRAALPGARSSSWRPVTTSS